MAKFLNIQGKKDIEEFYKKLLIEKELLIFGPAGIMADKFPEHAFEWENESRDKFIKEIVGPNDSGYAEKNSTKKHQIKIFDKSPFADFVIFRDNVLMTSFGDNPKKEEPSVIVISDVHISKNFKMIFEAVWNSIK